MYKIQSYKTTNLNCEMSNRKQIEDFYLIFIQVPIMSVLKTAKNFILHILSSYKCWLMSFDVTLHQTQCKESFLLYDFFK